MSRAALALVLLTLSAPACAWNRLGHMMVAARAYGELTAAARARASALLKLNPSYAQWVAQVSGGERDERIFMLAANWADDIKSDPGYRNDGEHPKGADASLNVGYSDTLQHRYWHYVDEPFSPDHTPLSGPQVPNALTQITAFRKVLASDASDAVKSYDLVWLLHLVGDVHQPLHATSRFTQALPAGDAGGNRVALCLMPCRDQLHAFWDDVLGSSSVPEVALQRARRLPRAPSRLAAIDDESRWVQESFELAQQVVYVPPLGPGAGPYSLDAHYRAQARKVARQQVALAGERLARLLNEALDR